MKDLEFLKHIKMPEKQGQVISELYKKSKEKHSVQALEKLI